MSFVIVINQVLVIGIGVHSFDMTMINPILIVNDLQHRRNGICSAGSGGDYLIVRLHLIIINTINNILERTFAWRCQHYLAGTL